MGTLTYLDQDTTFTLNCQLRKRGFTAKIYQKAAYAVKILGNDLKSKDVRFGNMRKDNYWILDAMASDLSRMRNAVSMQLWLDFSTPPFHQDKEPKEINGTRGEYVEVWANDNYAGLYRLTERIDRKQLKLKKFSAVGYTIHGLLYKAAKNVSRTNYFYYNSTIPSDTLTFWDGVEAQYPDIEDNEPFTWRPLRDAVTIIATNTRSQLKCK